MTKQLWSLEELARLTGGSMDGVATAPVRGFSIDSRALVPGEIFVALQDVRDGHEFVPAAFARGAAAALVRRGYSRQAADGALLRVDDPLRALEAIGVAARARLAPTARIVAVTGSAGKTGTKEMLRAAFQATASSPERVHAPEKSFNNHWGVPLTLARMPADTEYAVFEIGMNHANEIRPLAKMVRPQVAIVTNVLPVHVGNFEDGEIGVANAKSEIFEGLDPGGVAIILRDSPHYALLRQKAEAQGARVVTFGRHAESDVHLEAVSDAKAGDAIGSQHVVAVMRASRRRVGFDLGMRGDHLAMNAMAVIAAIGVLGMDVDGASRALALVQAAAGRGARLFLRSPSEGELLLLDESYNANPASMAAALANLEAVDPTGRRIAVMGDMLELAPPGRLQIAVDYHTGLLPALERIDRVLCCGPMMRHLFDMVATEKQAGWAPNSLELIPAVLAEIRPGDAVMVKGSLGSRMAPIVDAIKKRFDGG